MIMKEIVGPGYSVQILGRAGVRYREGSHTVYVDGEMLVGEYNFVIVENFRMWEDTRQLLSEEKRKEIVEKIRAAFQQEGLRLLVEPSP
jgi:hypothetical protein